MKQKIIKIDKPLAGLPKTKRERTHKIRNEKDVKIDIKEVQRIKEISMNNYMPTNLDNRRNG